MKFTAFAVAALFVCEAWMVGQARTIRRTGNEVESDQPNIDPLLDNDGALTNPGISTDTSAPVSQAVSMNTFVQGSSDAAYTDEASGDTSMIHSSDRGDPGLSTFWNIAAQPEYVSPDVLPLLEMDKVTQKELDILIRVGKGVKNGQLEYICVQLQDGHYVLNKQSKSAMWDDFANDLRVSGPGYAVHWSVTGHLVGIVNALNVPKTWSQRDNTLLQRNSIVFFGKIELWPPIDFMHLVDGEPALTQLQETLFSG